jgi:hypothetical protein
VQDAFVAIATNVGFHISREQTHVLPPLSLYFLHRQVDIVLSIDGVCTLVYVIIANSTQVDLILQDVFSHGVATIVTTHAKDNLYHDWFSVDMFFPLSIKVLGVYINMRMGFFINVPTWHGE